MDPMMIAMLMMQAGQNPEQMAQMLDQAGLPAPGTAGASAAGIPTNVPGAVMDDGSLGAMLRGILPQGQGAAAAAPVAPTAPMAAQSPMQVKAPDPVKPIMQGGVTGGVHPPSAANLQFGGTSPAMALMQALLTQQQNPLRVPALGSMLRGGKY